METNAPGPSGNRTHPEFLARELITQLSLGPGKRRKMKTILKVCQTCQLTFEASLKEHKRGNAKFCSIKCIARLPAKPKIPNTKCSYCDVLFYKRPSSLKNSKHGYYFCCREHKDLSQRLGGIKEIQPPHYGVQSNPITYRTTAFRSHAHKCNRCGFNKIIGILVVHHVDRNRQNNSPSNLEILCPNCHYEEHYLCKDGPYNNRK